jgi:hypothetical protein
MWLHLLTIGKLLELSLGGATRGKWRIPDGKVSEWNLFMFRALMMIAPT